MADGGGESPPKPRLSYPCGEDSDELNDDREDSCAAIDEATSIIESVESANRRLSLRWLSTI